MQPAPLLTVPEAAEFFRVTPQTVRRWTREGRLTAVLLPSGYRRYRRADLERLREEGAEDTGDAA